MSKGISIYLGMDTDIEENLKLIRESSKLKYKNIFTSLQLAEANYEVVMRDFNLILKEAKLNDMEVTADISPITFKYLSIPVGDLKALKNLGIDVIRLDYGFSMQEILKYINNDCGIKIQMNASTLNEKFIKDLEENNTNFDNILSCHNFYPREYTGISEETFLRKNKILKEKGIKVAAFISSLQGRRGPLFEGLPTLECHRNLNPMVSAKHLFLLGTDEVYFGDAMPSKNELEAVSKVSEEMLELRFDPFYVDEVTKKYIGKTFSNRPDEAEYCIRCSEGRIEFKDLSIVPKNNIDRSLGYVTIDNNDYLRYKGELQIALKNMPKDKRVNVIGKIIEEEQFLLKYIRENIRFCLVK